MEALEELQTIIDTAEFEIERELTGGSGNPFSSSCFISNRFLLFDWGQGAYSGTLFQNLTSNTSRMKQLVPL